MSSSADYFLKKTLGEDIFESLSKVELWKPGTRTTIDHEEIKTALKIVPKTIMSLLIRELAPMKLGETRQIPIPVPGEAILRITKHERDVFSGDILFENKVIVDFKYRSLPGIGLVIMSAFEMYDVDSLDSPEVEDPTNKIQKLIDERLALYDLINKVVDKKIMEREAVNTLLLTKLTDTLNHAEKKAKQVEQLVGISKQTTPMSDPYFQGITNGLVVADAVINEKEPEFVSAPKKGSPLKKFIENRSKKKEFSVHMAKGETVDCPDCGQNIFNGQLFSACICYGDDMERKIFMKKSEDGIKVRFSKGWDEENISMLLETLRRRNG